MKAFVYRTNGVTEIVAAPEEFELSWVGKQIGCDWIEVVRPERLVKYKEDLVMLVDEEGLLKPNELNLVGSWLYCTDQHGSPIAGDIMIAKEVLTDDGYDLAYLSDDEVYDLADYLHECHVM